MVYITLCPKCQETVSFLNNEDAKTCKKCGEVVINIKIEENASRQNSTGNRPIRRKRKSS